MPKHQSTLQLDGWLGINNVLRPERTPPNLLKEALNVDLDKSGGIHKRLGYTLLSSGDYHSLWSDQELCYCVKDGQLIKINQDYTETAVASNINCSLHFARTSIGVLVVGDTFRGILNGTSLTDFGIVGAYPTVIATTGLLAAGDYQVALTYLYASGLESGTGVAVKTTVGPLGGLVVAIPASPDPAVVSTNVYVSTPDGDELYLVTTLAAGVNSTTITGVSTAVLPLPSFNMQPAPYGNLIGVYKGRAFIASGKVLSFSQPYSYHWFDVQKDYFYFNQDIVAVMPVESGIWIATDNGLYYLSGRDTDSMKVELKEPVVCVRGTEVRIQGSYIFIDNTPIGYKWLITTKTGIFICFNDGIALNMTEKNYVLPEADDGTALFVQRDGINRYLAILDKKKESQNTAVGDQVSAAIIRNGIVLED